jgi:hypothetical protein
VRRVVPLTLANRWSGVKVIAEDLLKSRQKFIKAWPARF